jgi:hypothetical protein
MNILVAYYGRGPGGIYGFFPQNTAARRLLRRLFPEAHWHCGSMMVEQRFAYDAGRALEENEVELLRAGDLASITVNGGFVLRAVAS